jgi:hypothetical protein
MGCFGGIIKITKKYNLIYLDLKEMLLDNLNAKM